MGWSADSTVITADSTYVTADGSVYPPPSSTPYTALITSEHNQKPQFMALVTLLTGAVGDINAFIQSIPDAFDLDLAIGAQLDIIGLWVGQSRVVADVLLLGFFGFPDDPAALTMGEFGNTSFNAQYAGVFYEFGETFEETTTLTDVDYRLILRARIVRNQSNGTLSAIENALQYIFGVPCYVTDTGNLSLGITVTAPITQIQEALLTNLDLLPRPASVAIGNISYSPL